MPLVCTRVSLFPASLIRKRLANSVSSNFGLCKKSDSGDTNRFVNTVFLTHFDTHMSSIGGLMNDRQNRSRVPSILRCTSQTIVSVDHEFTNNTNPNRLLELQTQTLADQCMCLYLYVQQQQYKAKYSTEVGKKYK